MARITPEAGSASNNDNNNNNTQRAEKISVGSKICVMLGFFFETHYGNKKLQIGYAVIDDDPEGTKATDLSEVGLIHIDSLLIRDTVMWKHSRWSSACGYSEPYDNEDHSDIMKIILNCPAIQCNFVEREYTTRNGEQRKTLEIGSWDHVPPAKAQQYISKAGIDKLINLCEQNFEKIIDYRVKRGDQIVRYKAQASQSSNPVDEFDQFVENNQGGPNDEIPF